MAAIFVARLVTKREKPSQAQSLKAVGRSQLSVACAANSPIFTGMICLLRGGGLAAAFLALAGTLLGAESLVWRKAAQSVDADLTGAELIPVLEKVAEATGWAIYLEPGTKKSVTTKFKDRAPDRALDLMLGDLGRVLLPGTNGGPPRLLVFRSAQTEATQRIVSRKPKPIPNELIVTVKPGTDLDALAKKLGAKIVGRSKGLNSARLSFADEASTDAARKALESNEDVLSTDANFAVTDQPVPEDLAAAGRQGPGIRPVQAGDPVVVALLDTHIGSLGPEYDGFLSERLSVASGSSSPTESLEHGSAMFGTAVNAMKGANQGSNVRFLSVDVYGGNALTTTYELTEGLYLAAQKKATVVSMSLGADGDSPYLGRYIEELIKAGYVIVASAGNQPVTTPTYPAAYSGVVAVTAGVGPGQLAPYANRGSFVDVMAPGTSFINYNGLTWRVTGTSPAAAYVAGVIADKMDARGMTAKEAIAWTTQAFPPVSTGKN
jgi:thermitase